jgi:hypothetical protein
MNFRTISIAAVAAGLFAVPALAHHSFAMFDADKTVEFTGTVKELQWTNPHSWLEINVVQADGKEVVWAFEMGSPGGLARVGWRPRTVVPGDKVTVTGHPLRDGTTGAQFISVKLPDGKVLTD